MPRIDAATPEERAAARKLINDFMDLMDNPDNSDQFKAEATARAWCEANGVSFQEYAYLTMVYEGLLLQARSLKAEKMINTAPTTE